MEYLSQSLKNCLSKYILVPLVAYDEKLYRIGYGGGYYDRYLKKLKRKKLLQLDLLIHFKK